MSSRHELNESYKRAFVIKAIPFLKDVHGKTQLGYNSIDVKRLCDKHDIPTNTVPTMVDLTILSVQGEKRNAMYHWKSGPVSEDLASKIYDRAQMNKRHAKMRKQMEEQQDSTFKKKNLVKVIGTRRPVEFAKDLEAAAILRSMNAVHASTKDNMKTRAMILEIIKRESNNDTLAERILKGLIDANYIKVEKNLNTVELFKWKEADPDEEHALFIKEIIRETIGNSGNTKLNRIFDFLMCLHKLKTYTPLNLRTEITRFNLAYNDQTVITKEVLDIEGPKVSRKYKWRLNEAPSMALAESLYKKIRAYGDKYVKPSTTKKSEKPVKEIKTTKPAKLEKKSSGQIILDYLKNNETMTTDKACEITGLGKKPVADLLWKLKKDGSVFKIAYMTYSANKNTKPPVVKPETKKSVEEEPVVVYNKQHLGDDEFIANLRMALLAMEGKEVKLAKELADVRAKIKEGRELLDIREREASFMTSVSKYIGKKKPSVSEVTTAMSNSRDKSRKKYPHNKQAILDALNKREQVSINEFVEMFYPGQKLNWESGELKSLSVMLYTMKKDGIVESPATSVFKLKRT